MKYAAARPFAEPETAARKLVEIASGVEAVQVKICLLSLAGFAFVMATPARFGSFL